MWRDDVIYEGMLDVPTHRRTWDVVERHRVTTLVTTPSVLRNLRRWPDSRPREGQLDSLRCVVTGGEHSEHELRGWVASEVLASDSVVGDAWGQTELGGIAVFTDTPRADALPRPGLDVVGPDGRSVGAGSAGELVLREPWPGTFVGIQNGDPAAAARYWERYAGVYATGDSALLQPDGSVVFVGRIDPVVNVSGQLVSLTEVRDALLEHPFVADAEIIDRNDPDEGQTLVACVVLADPAGADETLASALRTHVRERLGGLAQPRTIAFVDTFPDDVALDVRRRALRVVCAADRTGTLSISADRLRAAASSAGASRDGHS